MSNVSRQKLSEMLNINQYSNTPSLFFSATGHLSILEDMLKSMNSLRNGLKNFRNPDSLRVKRREKGNG